MVLRAEMMPLEVYCGNLSGLFLKNFGHTLNPIWTGTATFLKIAGTGIMA
jgi:hypothetical protein